MLWICDCCGCETENIHFMEWDESLCDDCLESYLLEYEENFGE